MADVLAAGSVADLARLAEVAEEFGFDMDPSSVPRLAAAHQLRLS